MRDKNGKFIKGHKGFWSGVKGVVGRKKGHIVSFETREKIRKYQLGRKCSLETKKKMSISKIGKRKGIRFPSLSGNNHWNWKGGITPMNNLFRNTLEYREWRLNIWKRDLE